jgi:hypothetical protein
MQCTERMGPFTHFSCVECSDYCTSLCIPDSDVSVIPGAYEASAIITERDVTHTLKATTYFFMFQT